MRVLPDTVVARSIAILIAALFAVHFLGYWAYRIGVSTVAEHAQDRALAERVVSIKRASPTSRTRSMRDRPHMPCRAEASRCIGARSVWFWQMRP